MSSCQNGEKKIEEYFCENPVKFRLKESMKSMSTERSAYY